MTRLNLSHQLLSLALAATVTLGLLSGVGGLARHEAGRALAAHAQQTATPLAAAEPAAPAV
ncbi:hypothetical protein [Aquabacterium sp. OR-4]|uniref:hypothetical protein n=1 Tax=Aquabacterium sp. OR-4 TaxID=2978127 RepID=UPI0021B32CEA|nr:hypothetical protein [Aquabacterium sp. OR-4]MDT7833890.1 hypothetical protein [Aquabacterium sp. OR-4]